jgi:hypothetical protein
MSPLHPFTVHLPIGLLIGNAIMTALYLWRGDRSLETAAYHCLWLGWLLLLPAVVTGTIDAARGTELEFVIMVIAVSCVKLLSAHNSTQHTSRKHKV